MKNKFLILFLVSLLVCDFAAGADSQDYVYEHTIDLKDGSYLELKVPFHAISKTPMASPEEGKVPVSLKDAISKAQEALHSNFSCHSKEAKLQDIQLWFDSNSQRWIYIVRFMTPLVFIDHQEPSGGISIPIVVLMNNEAIAPTVAK